MKCLLHLGITSIKEDAYAHWSGGVNFMGA